MIRLCRAARSVHDAVQAKLATTSTRCQSRAGPVAETAAAAAPAPAREAASAPPKSRLSALTIAAIGVVYGDIGTSPLYTMRVAFGSGVLPLTEASVLGVLSLVSWALFTVVTLKYVIVILRADNRGEGGILALASLAQRTLASGRRRTVLVLAMIGAALFYGDGVITPAISVLSAIEGLKVATPLFEPYVVPFALVILTALFLMQSRGTGNIGLLFGPVMCLWFLVLGLLGLIQIVQAPHILRALDPSYALALFGAHQWLAFVTLGAVFLAVTGAEALYADMGHFGRLPIRIAWFGLVLPGASAQLLRSRRVAARRSRHRGQSVLPAGPRVGALPDGRARHLGHGDRVAGGHLGRLFAQRAGGAARVPAAAHRAPHVGTDDGSDLHPRDQLVAARRRCPAGPRLSSPRATLPRLTASRSAAPWRSPPCSPGSSRAAAGAGRPRSW